MTPTWVLNVVGLTGERVGEHTPNLRALADSGSMRALRPVLPAVTTTVQTSFVTGAAPASHGIIANGWYFRDLSEIWFWRQSNKLVHGERVWDAGRAIDPEFTCANLFWWYNMYSGADIGVTPRPMYPADGRKIPDCYAEPPELRDELTRRLGRFPLFKFWGPATSIESSQWIADCASLVAARHRPTLTLVYLPHLDYNFQRLGPDHPDCAADLRQVDAVCGQLIDAARRDGARVMVVSEYGIMPVNRPVHINRALREAGLVRVREELGREQLDAGASEAFAVADHQVAHVYVRDPQRTAEVRDLLAALPGVDQVLDDEGKRATGLDHPRSGELVAIAAADSWFTYYHFLDDERAPDFARTVEIHRKPGFDPVELFIDPAIRLPKLAVGWRLAKRALGMRTLLDVIPLDAGLVRGSHGRLTGRPEQGPVCISSEPDLLDAHDTVSATAVKQIMLEHVFGRDRARGAQQGDPQ